MGVLHARYKCVDRARIRDVQGVELDGGKSAMGVECLRISKLRVIINICHSSLAAGLVACG